MRLTSFIFLLFAVSQLSAQSCGITLSGYILDKGTNIPLPYSTVFLEESQTGVVSDSLGFFELKNVCIGEEHLEITHIGCQPFHQFLQISKDTTFTIYLNHHAELLDEVVVHGSHEDNSTQNSSTISRLKIEENSHKNLSDLLETITGVSTLKNGAGISKPVVHGLFGNRVAILNNGIAQSGQQWGNDHAPEIDPSIADHISVVKGAAALAHSANSLGSIVMVETAPIKKDPHLHGAVNYAFQSNGLGNTLNGQLEKNGRWAAWRVSGTLNLRGDTRAPNYFLTNTGKREGNLAFQLEKKISDRWHTDVYFSSFNTEIGVLRGAHIGNLTDLEDAIGSEQPFGIDSSFSYAINPPRQVVNHQLLKIESKHFLSEQQVLKFKYGGQLNQRKEFDIRRGNRSHIPALSLQQYTHFFEGVFNQEWDNDWLLKAGLQYNFIDNVNKPGTGIFPLIPNYESHTTSGFLILQKEQNRLFYELGGRYDFRQLNVVTFTDDIPVEIIRPNHQFHNYAFSGGAKYRFSENLKLNWNAGLMMRAPEVNELYSGGLHQGVSGIEEGDENLQQEKSFKTVLSVDWFVDKKLFIQALGYYQHVDDFIFLNPQDEFELTIRGAFPVFAYEQTDARISGVDLLVSYEPVENIKWTTQYAMVKGRDLTNNLGLVNIPANNLFSSITWSFKDGQKMQQNSFSINGKYVWQQDDIDKEQDFLAPPDAYFLLGFRLGTSIAMGENKLRISIQGENVFNTTYRDYLNRLRYFADELGANFSVNLNYAW